MPEKGTFRGRPISSSSVPLFLYFCTFHRKALAYFQTVKSHAQLDDAGVDGHRARTSSGFFHSILSTAVNHAQIELFFNCIIFQNVFQYKWILCALWAFSNSCKRRDLLWNSYILYTPYKESTEVEQNLVGTLCTRFLLILKPGQPFSNSTASLWTGRCLTVLWLYNPAITRVFTLKSNTKINCKKGD